MLADEHLADTYSDACQRLVGRGREVWAGSPATVLRVNRPRPVLRPFRSQQYVICVQVGDARYKVAQLMFSGSDGSLFVQFPYYRHTDGLLAAATLEAHGSSLDLTDGGRITSHLVKYAHHPDGEAHFSQTGKVLTRVRRRATPLDEIDGHCFTIQVYGLEGFAPLDRALVDVPPTRRRTIISFLFESERPEAVKIVGRLHGADDMLSTAARGLSAPAVIGPIVATEDARGQMRPAFLVSTLSGQPGERRLLRLECESVPVPGESAGGPLLVFLGAFDPPAIALNQSLATSMLALQYPAADVAELRHRLDSIDIRSAQ